MIDFLNRNRRAVPISILLLVIQNIAIFFDHYLDRAYFPWDFTMTYYSVVAFWTTAIREGIFPQWMPFQSMGFPFQLILQSGLFYPPLWLFTLSNNLPYSTHAAIVLQCLHVLFGAVGIFLLIRLLTGSLSAALLGGVAFQFFGGFYSNAQHPDIVRSYAWLPWLFYLSQIEIGQRCLSLRNYLLPIGVFFFVAGAYPGTIISQMAFLVGIRLIEFFQVLAKKRTLKQMDVKWMLYVFGFCLMGIAFSSIVLIPGFLNRNFLVRSTQFEALRKENWDFKLWPHLFISWDNDSLGIDKSLVSAFLTLPIAFLLGCLNRRVMQRYFPWVVGLIASMLLAGGSESWVYRLLISLFPFFSFSRLPSVDYRGLVGLFGTLLGSVIFFQITQRQLKDKTVFRFLLIPVVFVIGVLIKVFPITAHPSEYGSGCIVTLLSFLLLLRIKKESVFSTIGFLLLVCFSGFNALNRSQSTWHALGNLNQEYKNGIGTDTSLPLPVSEVLRHPPSQRPGRKSFSEYGFSWRPYITGDFALKGLHSDFLQQSKIHEVPALIQYMTKAWTPVIATEEKDTDCKVISQKALPPQFSIKQTSYQLNEIHYQVDIPKAVTMIENEVYFPGWTGKTSLDNTTHYPTMACKSIRAWSLPKGKYMLTTRFQLPWFFESLVLSLLSFVAYLLFLLFRFAGIVRRLAVRKNIKSPNFAKHS